MLRTKLIHWFESVSWQPFDSTSYFLETFFFISNMKRVPQTECHTVVTVGGAGVGSSQVFWVIPI